MSKTDVFVKLEQYDKVEDAIKDVETKIAESRVTLKKLQQLNENEARELSEWQHYLSGIETKIEEIKQHLD